MTEQIFTIAMYVLQYLPVIWGFDQLFETRWSRKKSIALLIICAVCVMVTKHVVSMLWTTITPSEYIVVDSVVFTVQIAMLLIAFKGNIIKKIVAILIIMMMCPTIATIIAMAFFYNDTDNSYNEVYPVGALLVAVIIWICTPITVYFIKNVADKSLPKYTWIYLIFPFSQYLSLTAISDLVVLVPGENQSTHMYALLSSFSFLIADIVFLIIILKTTESERVRRKLEAEKYIHRSEQMYYRHITEKIQENMKIRHDMKNILAAAENLSSSSNDEYSNRLINELKRNINESEPHYFCENTILNAVLYDKSELASSKNIEFRSNVVIPEDIALDCYDLCRIFSNILDNAIEGACDSADKTININAKIDMGHLMIVAENGSSCIKNLKTTKRSQEKHGFGIHIIREISTKYNGDAEFFSTEKSFTCKAWLQIE